MPAGTTAPTPSPAEALPDGRLVREHLNGRDEAFGLLYRRYYDRVVEWSERRTSDPVLAEDVAQDTMVRVLEYAESFDQDRPMGPWLKTIAHRVLITRLQDQPDSDGSFEDQYDDEGECDPLLDSVELQPTLEQVLEQMSDRQQVALHLRYVRDWSVDHVADFFGLNRNACNQLMFRARKSARREFERVVS